MIAPKGPGHTVRWEYQNGQRVPALFAVEQDSSGSARSLALAYTKELEERELGFLKQTLKKKQKLIYLANKRFCGGLSELVKSGFETLVEAGYQPELAYFECP